LLDNVKIKFKRPGYGISPDVYETLKDKVFNKPLAKGALISIGDFS